MRKLIGLACLFGLLVVVFGWVNSDEVNAELKFQSTQQVQFTFNPTMSLQISDNLVITDLVPGTATDSNEVKVLINTNFLSGYYLTATSGTSSTNTDLINESSDVYRFNSLDPDMELPDMSEAMDNQWGYSFKVDDGNYGQYSGLPLDGDDADSGAILIDTSQAADSKVIGFKIGAKAASNQAFGNYSNVINFYIVSHPLPEEKTIEDIEYMQEFNTLSYSEKNSVLASMRVDEQYQLKDSRDEKTYYISKLVDGNVWMTQNLDHDIVTTTDFYTPANTDVPDYWTASTATYAAGTTTWNESDTTPESYDSGNYCWGGVGYGLVDCGTSLGEPNHYHLGNYYNWTAAVATNDSSSYDSPYGEVANQSICPAGWTLPTAGRETGSGSYENLLTGYGFSNFKMTDPHIWEGPLYFPLSGNYQKNGGIGQVGLTGSYWSSVIDSIHFAILLDIGSISSGDNVDPGGWSDRDLGFSVRCVAR